MNVRIPIVVLATGVFVTVSCNLSPTSTKRSVDWIKDSISTELQLALPLDALTIVERFQVDTLHPLIVATAKVDQLNGGFFIYRWKDNKYTLEYSKPEPVYNVQYNAGNHIVFESGFTGTGQKNTKFHLIEIGGSACTELWTEVASDYNFTSVAPYHSVDGSVQLNSLDESFIYTKIERTFWQTEFDLNKPDSISSRSQVLRFADFSVKH